MRRDACVNHEEFRIADREFHDAVAQMCGNEFLKLQNSILSGVFFPVPVPVDVIPDLRVVSEHEEIYRKLVAGDADGTATAARIHIEKAMQFLQEQGLVNK
jgi:DNA-binding FadR family transcriptional regulator